MSLDSCVYCLGKCISKVEVANHKKGNIITSKCPLFTKFSYASVIKKNVFNHPILYENKWRWKHFCLAFGNDEQKKQVMEFNQNDMHTLYLFRNKKIILFENENDPRIQDILHSGYVLKPEHFKKSKKKASKSKLNDFSK